MPVPPAGPQHRDGAHEDDLERPRRLDVGGRPANAPDRLRHEVARLPENAMGGDVVAEARDGRVAAVDQLRELRVAQ